MSLLVLGQISASYYRIIPFANDLGHRSTKALHVLKMFIHPSILISLFLLIKLAAPSTTLAPYFVPTAAGVKKADGILKKHQSLWPGVSPIEGFRASLETGENDKVESILENLNYEQIDTVLDAVLHPSSTDKMLENLEQVAAHLSVLPVRNTVRAHIFIHQRWTKTKLMLAAADDTTKELCVFVYAATALICKIFKRKRFLLIRTIFNTMKQRQVPILINHILHSILEGRHVVYDLTVTFVLNDTGKYITANLFKMLSKTEKPTVQDFRKLLENHAVDSQQFAKIISALLSHRYINHDEVRDLVYLTDPSDIQALKEHLKSEEIQTKFFHHFGVLRPTNMDSAWSTLVLKRNDRCGESRKKHARLILKRLRQIDPPLLPSVLFPIISAYAA